MKLKTLFPLTILACMLAAGCGSDDELVFPVQPPQESIIGNMDSPAWALPDGIDMTSSMTAIVSVDLSLTYPSEVAALSGTTVGAWSVTAADQLAAFDGETCVGVASLVDGLFFLYVTRPSGTQPLCFRYYSAQLRNVFVAKDVCTFEPDACQGSVSAPLTPPFQLLTLNY